MNALIASAPQAFPRETDARQIRDTITQLARNILDQPSDPYHESLSYTILSGIAQQQANADVRAGRADALTVDEHAASLLPNIILDDHRAQVLSDLGTSGSWAGPEGDIALPLAARAYNLRVAVIHPGGRVTNLTQDGDHAVTLVRVPGHWHATARVPGAGHPQDTVASPATPHRPPTPRRTTPKSPTQGRRLPVPPPLDTAGHRQDTVASPATPHRPPTPRWTTPKSPTQGRHLPVPPPLDTAGHRQDTAASPATPHRPPTPRRTTPKSPTPGPSRLEKPRRGSVADLPITGGPKGVPVLRLSTNDYVATEQEMFRVGEFMDALYNAIPVEYSIAGTIAAAQHVSDDMTEIFLAWWKHRRDIPPPPRTFTPSMRDNFFANLPEVQAVRSYTMLLYAHVMAIASANQPGRGSDQGTASVLPVAAFHDMRDILQMLPEPARSFYTLGLDHSDQEDSPPVIGILGTRLATDIPEFDHIVDSAQPPEYAEQPSSQPSWTRLQSYDRYYVPVKANHLPHNVQLYLQGRLTQRQAFGIQKEPILQGENETPMIKLGIVKHLDEGESWSLINRLYEEMRVHPERENQSGLPEPARVHFDKYGQINPRIADDRMARIAKFLASEALLRIEHLESPPNVEIVGVSSGGVFSNPGATGRTRAATVRRELLTLVGNEIVSRFQHVNPSLANNFIRRLVNWIVPEDLIRGEEGYDRGVRVAVRPARFWSRTDDYRAQRELRELREAAQALMAALPEHQESFLRPRELEE